MKHIISKISTLAVLMVALGMGIAKTVDPLQLRNGGPAKKVVAGIPTVTHAGMIPAEFEQIIKGWIVTEKYPKMGLLYTEMVYQTMRNVLSQLTL